MHHQSQAEARTKTVPQTEAKETPLISLFNDLALVTSLAPEVNCIVASYVSVPFKKENALYVVSTYHPREFAVLTERIKNSDAYKDPHSKILIEKEKIYFGHSLREIEASFPDIYRNGTRRIELGYYDGVVSFSEGEKSFKDEKTTFQEVQTFFDTTQKKTPNLYLKHCLLILIKR